LLVADFTTATLAEPGSNSFEWSRSVDKGLTVRFDSIPDVV